VFHVPEPRARVDAGTHRGVRHEPRHLHRSVRARWWCVAAVCWRPCDARCVGRCVALPRCRGTDVISPHGVPVDLLDRMLIIRTMPYSLEEINMILSIRAQTEGLEIEDDALALLGSIGSRASLRYVVARRLGQCVCVRVCVCVCLCVCVCVCVPRAVTPPCASVLVRRCRVLQICGTAADACPHPCVDARPGKDHRHGRGGDRQAVL
jgi:hypothetical protein